MSDLARKKCRPCEGGAPALSPEEAERYMPEVPGWKLAPDGKSIACRFVMKNFLAAVDFIAQIARVAEAEDHHPDIHLTAYRNLTVVLATHALEGLSENDFIVAAKIRELKGEFKENPYQE